MATDELQYNTPQDKLLIMLLERISALEDEQHKLRQTIEQSIKSPFVMNVAICIESKRTSSNGPFNWSLMLIKRIIQEVFPQCTLYIETSLVSFLSKVSTILYLVFETPVSLDTVKQALHYKLFEFVDIHDWMTLTDMDMKTLLQTRVRKYEFI